jgi:hypothetical protein
LQKMKPGEHLLGLTTWMLCTSMCILLQHPCWLGNCACMILCCAP